MSLVREAIVFCIIQTFTPPAPFFSLCLVEDDVLHLDAQDRRLIHYRFQSVPFFSIHIDPPTRTPGRSGSL